MRTRLQALRERDWQAIDRVLIGMITLITVVELSTTTHDRGPLALNLLLYGAMGFSMYWRRTRALLFAAIVIAGSAIAAIWLTLPPDLLGAIFLLLTASYSVGAHSERREAFIGALLTVGGVFVLALDYNTGDWIFPTVFFAFLPWLVGRVMRTQTHLTRELADKAGRAEIERELEASRAIAEERRRVARELHDVLAHDLSVMVVQAGAGRRIIENDPERAAEAARLIERTGREALAELRHLFGPVRRGGAESLDGAPGLDGLERLVERARAAGLPVELRVDGDRRKLPPGIDLASYRVIQEALTNSIKHADAGSAQVSVAFSASELVLEVSDDGVGPSDESAPDGSGGHGLIGMSERVALYGGELETGRRRGGGFTVRARLPLSESAVAA